MLDQLLAAIPSPGFDRISLGPLTLRLYGIAIALGVVAAVEIGRRRWAARALEPGETEHDPDDIVLIAQWGVPAGLIGARLYHVITDWHRFSGDPLRIVKIWEGGLGIPGGLILGVGVGAWYVRSRGWNLWSLVDTIIPGIPVAQAIGRLGNWFNQEVYGRPTDLPWALEIDPEHRVAGYENFATFHPTFLYEGLWNLALAAFLIWLDSKKVLRPGQILPVWIIGYGLGRFLVESVRIDEATMLAGLRVNTWVSGAAIAIGVVWLLMWNGRAAEAAATDEEAAAAGDEVVSDGDALDVEAE